MSGMTEQGFIPKRAAEILEEMRLEALEIRDPSTGEQPFFNLTDDSVIGQILAIVAEEIGQCWAAAGMAAVQFDPLKNYGAAQAGTVQLNSITRNEGTPTIINMALSGQPGTLIPAGSLIAAGAGDVVYSTAANAVIAADRTAEVAARSTVKGPFEPEPGTVFAIQTPVSGWESASNTAILSVGSYGETDTQLRLRQQRSTSLTSYRQIEAIQAAVADVPGVVYARAYQNSSVNPQDERGIPFKEVAVVAAGGDSRAIATALFLRFPAGQTGYGNTHEVFYDAQGQAYTIGFSRPVEVPVHVSVSISITSRADFPDNGAELIKRAIIEYAEHGGEGNGYGFPPGRDIIRTRLFTPINSIPGHSIAAMKIGLAPDALGDEDIAIAWDHVGAWDADNITVEVSV